jgi:hypothetical protein
MRSLPSKGKNFKQASDSAIARRVNLETLLKILIPGLVPEVRSVLEQQRESVILPVIWLRPENPGYKERKK